MLSWTLEMLLLTSRSCEQQVAVWHQLFFCHVQAHNTVNPFCSIFLTCRCSQQIFPPNGHHCFSPRLLASLHICLIWKPSLDQAFPSRAGAWRAGESRPYHPVGDISEWVFGRIKPRPIQIRFQIAYKLQIPWVKAEHKSWVPPKTMMQHLM